MSHCVPSWIPIVVVSSALMKYVSSCFNRVESTWALNFFFGKKSKSVFAYRSMIYYSSQGSSTKQIIMSKELELQSFFGA